MANKTVKVTQTRSAIGRLPKHKASLRGLGLRRLNSSAVLEDTPAVRGMITMVRYLVKSESV